MNKRPLETKYLIFLVLVLVLVFDFLSVLSFCVVRSGVGLVGGWGGWGGVAWMGKRGHVDMEYVFDPGYIYILSKNENFTWYYTNLYMFAFIIETLEVH